MMFKQSALFALLLLPTLLRSSQHCDESTRIRNRMILNQLARLDQEAKEAKEKKDLVSKELY